MHIPSDFVEWYNVYGNKFVYIIKHDHLHNCIGRTMLNKETFNTDNNLSYFGRLSLKQYLVNLGVSRVFH